MAAPPNHGHGQQAAPPGPPSGSLAGAGAGAGSHRDLQQASSSKGCSIEHDVFLVFDNRSVPHNHFSFDIDAALFSFNSYCIREIKLLTVNLDRSPWHNRLTLVTAKQPLAADLDSSQYDYDYKSTVHPHQHRQQQFHTSQPTTATVKDLDKLLATPQPTNTTIEATRYPYKGHQTVLGAKQGRLGGTIDLSSFCEQHVIAGWKSFVAHAVEAVHSSLLLVRDASGQSKREVHLTVLSNDFQLAGIDTTNADLDAILPIDSESETTNNLIEPLITALRQLQRKLTHSLRFRLVVCTIASPRSQLSASMTSAEAADASKLERVQRLLFRIESRLRSALIVSNVSGTTNSSHATSPLSVDCVALAMCNASSSLLLLRDELRYLLVASSQRLARTVELPVRTMRASMRCEVAVVMRPNSLGASKGETNSLLLLSADRLEAVSAIRCDGLDVAFIQGPTMIVSAPTYSDRLGDDDSPGSCEANAQLLEALSRTMRDMHCLLVLRTLHTRPPWVGTEFWALIPSAPKSGNTQMVLLRLVDSSDLLDNTRMSLTSSPRCGVDTLLCGDDDSILMTAVTDLLATNEEDDSVDTAEAKTGKRSTPANMYNPYLFSGQRAEAKIHEMQLAAPTSQAIRMDGRLNSAPPVKHTSTGAKGKGTASVSFGHAVAGGPPSRSRTR